LLCKLTQHHRIKVLITCSYVYNATIGSKNISEPTVNKTLDTQSVVMRLHRY